MNSLTIISISIVILLHALFLILEMFLWNKSYGKKIFSLPDDFARQSAPLAANQGLYNGFLAAGLTWGLVSTDGYDVLIFFLCCIITAGIYGAITIKKSIFWLQAFPAIVAMFILIINS